jgi:hypothetical protein
MTAPPPFGDPRLPMHSQELLARARQYRDAAMPMVDIVNARPNWPKYTLLMHAIELALKAAIVSYGESGFLWRANLRYGLTCPLCAGYKVRVSGRVGEP